MCPTAISMNAYVLRIHILPYVVELCSESVLTRHPDTGLARRRVLVGIFAVAPSLPPCMLRVCSVWSWLLLWRIWS
ncbi:Uncharacterised protein [Salmonella enterica subsp. enterica serovar Typhi]|nr:Uncharacterised protein [Salmonella enterica subsp. enterica serovar Typhi]